MSWRGFRWCSPVTARAVTKSWSNTFNANVWHATVQERFRMAKPCGRVRREHVLTWFRVHRNRAPCKFPGTVAHDETRGRLRRAPDLVRLQARRQSAHCQFPGTFFKRRSPVTVRAVTMCLSGFRWSAQARRANRLGRFQMAKPRGRTRRHIVLGTISHATPPCAVRSVSDARAPRPRKP